MEGLSGLQFSRKPFLTHRTWMTLLNNNEWWHYDFVAKAGTKLVIRRPLNSFTVTRHSPTFPLSLGSVQL